MKKLALILLATFSVACVKNSPQQASVSDLETSQLYSKAGREVKIQFSAKFRSAFKDVASVKALGAAGKQKIDAEITRTLKFLFGRSSKSMNSWRS